jgi:hypothetical protein
MIVGFTMLFKGTDRRKALLRAGHLAIASISLCGGNWSFPHCPPHWSLISVLHSLSTWRQQASGEDTCSFLFWPRNKKEQVISRREQWRVIDDYWSLMVHLASITWFLKTGLHC